MENIIDNLINALSDYTDKITPIVQKKESISTEIDSGKYSLQEINNTLFPALANTKRDIESAKEAATKAAAQAIDAHIAELEADDALNASDLTDDCRLLNAGIKLQVRDITAMLARNANNKTMTQIILRYARENNIDIGRTYFIGNEQAIRNARELSYVVGLYVKNWIDKPNARDMLAKLFGR